MRRVLALTVLALTLAGCTAYDVAAPEVAKEPATVAEPATETVDPSALVGLWRVTEAGGKESDTWLRLADELMVWSECGRAHGSWIARGSAFLADVSSWGSGYCAPGYEVDGTPWLSAAASWVEQGDAIALYSEEDELLVTLTIDGAPPKSKDHLDEYVDQPVENVDSFGALSPLPDGVEAPDDIVGRWVNRASPYDGSFIVLASDRTWRDTDTSFANGRWALGEDGAILTTSRPVDLIGCARNCGSDVAYDVVSAARVGVTDSGLAFFAADGSLLVEVIPA